MNTGPCRKTLSFKTRHRGELVCREEDDKTDPSERGDVLGCVGPLVLFRQFVHHVLVRTLVGVLGGPFARGPGVWGRLARP